MKRTTITCTSTRIVVETFVIDHDETEPDWPVLVADEEPTRVEESNPAHEYVVTDEETLYIVTQETANGPVYLNHSVSWTYDPTYAGHWAKVTAEHHAVMWRAGGTDAVAVPS